jgi:hypothetical protein
VQVQERAAKAARENPAVKVVLQSGAYGHRGLKAALEDVELQVIPPFLLCPG